MQREDKNHRLYKGPIFLVIAVALVLTALLTAAVGTLTWLKYFRSQQTVTLVHVSDHYLLGPDGSNATAINLGNIDVSEPGSRFYAFGVKSNQPSYRFQLAYTTNIPFTYTIYRAIAASSPNGDYSNPHSEGGFTFYYTDTALPGVYLNKGDGDRIANDTKHPVSFGSSSVAAQRYAEPVYWQTSDDVNRLDSIDYFVLEITWNSPLHNDKETDLIYLTVGAPLGGSQ